MYILNILIWWFYALSFSLAAPNLPKQEDSNSADVVSVSSLTPIPSSPSTSSIAVSSSTTASIPTALRNTTSSAVLEKRYISYLGIKTTPGVAWPRHPPSNRVYIRYCYATQEVRNEVKCLFDQARDLWGEALGGKASEESGHAIMPTEAKDESMRPLLCYEDAAGTVWNRYMPADALVISLVPDEIGDRATIGYYGTSQKGKHTLSISQSRMRKQQVHVIAHEFGHVLGMGHEHQRKDRDEHMLFQCDQLRGFWDAYNKASVVDIHLKGPAIRERLCTDPEYAARYGFKRISSYTKIEDSQSTGFVFDWDSIMLYDSTAGAAGKCFELETWCPLLKKVINPATGAAQYVRFQGGRKPSVRDAAFIKQTYPYMPPVAGPNAPVSDQPPVPSVTSAPEPIIEAPMDLTD
ncbi:hypothetical protein DM02DRAFT_707767 [Periconia macrospinosa]|uniref:Peptidase metallopeptidase domain-containing protein n=1 Tax=Periconia macrospinosa TaxID=97972 RepID=A0A2V1DR24_9PLEO|nr:hypothetical protein DM02DRAFT_707767 [Periconia macrospinosa]